MVQPHNFSRYSLVSKASFTTPHEAPVIQNVSRFLPTHDTTKFDLKSGTHQATVYAHSHWGDLRQDPSFPRVLGLLPPGMSAEESLFEGGLKFLSEFHSQFPRADSSFIVISNKDQPHGSTLYVALEAKSRWKAFKNKKHGLEVLSQSYRYVDGITVASDNRLFRTIIEVKETFAPTIQKDVIFRNFHPPSRHTFREKAISDVFGESYRYLVKMVNQDGIPLDRCILLVAANVFKLLDEKLPQNRITDVLVSLKASESQERLRYAMTRSEYNERVRSIPLGSEEVALSHVAFIALGSNLGDRIDMLEAACGLMKAEGIQIQRTSGLYETAPMYLEEQERFINGVCQINTTLSPRLLLSKLQAIEQKLGRVKSVANGPRNIDLDILRYDDYQLKEPTLVIPHERMTERAFVLRPLCDIVANEWTSKVHTLFNPSFLKRPSFREVLSHLTETQERLFPITRISPSRPNIISELPTRKTHLMAILNLTPDSFSDGGIQESAPSALLDTLRGYIQDGATIIDVGGQSSRPGATEVSAEEEAGRVIPAIELMRSNPEFDKIIISVDTYRASVARAAVEAGAHIINDVSAGLMDPEMLSTVASLGCTVILGHMRGTPLTMAKLTNYGSSVSRKVGEELLARFRAAEEAGIYRWRIILDPGIGFAKNQVQNLEILRAFSKLRETEGLEGLPWCVGSSRKGFIGNITGIVVQKERVVGSTTCAVAAIQGGAEIVRAHDVKETAEAIKMADAIWRVEEKRESQKPTENHSLKLPDLQEVQI